MKILLETTPNSSLYLAAYYYEQQVSIAARYVRQKQKCFSFGCLPHETSHVAERTWTAIRDLLDEVLDAKIRNQITELNIISNEPCSPFACKPPASKISG